MSFLEVVKDYFMVNGGSNVVQPIFIGGCGRSGTTLLFDTLSTRPTLNRTTGYPDGEDHEGWVTHGKCVMAGIGNVHHSKFGYEPSDASCSLARGLFLP